MMGFYSNIGTAFLEYIFFHVEKHFVLFYSTYILIRLYNWQIKNEITTITQIAANEGLPSLNHGVNLQSY